MSTVSDDDMEETTEVVGLEVVGMSDGDGEFHWSEGLSNVIEFDKLVKCGMSVFWQFGGGKSGGCC